MRRLLPSPVAEISHEQTSVAYDRDPAVPWLRVSLVASLDGATRGPDGTSMSLSPPADRRVFSELRKSADVILVGAGSVRAGYYRPSRVPIAVVSRALNLSPDLALFAEANDDTPRTLVYTTGTAAAAAPTWLNDAAEVISAGATSVDPALIVDDLVQRGLPRIHCEGGPHLASSLATADLVDEYLVTLAPLLLGAPSVEHLLAIAGGLPHPRDWRFEHVLEEDGTVFVRMGRR